ncbi:hypothetical protein NIIg97_gp67 [Geobacillus phage vB_GthS_NIIg9.7]|nr:hypothetical protein NIIg97_gp67 [Geobacillus phage vB_GthS_NIIg9.7]UYL94251.1 hypothetical protein PT91_gp64 [Geobacillus phage vB_GthS_PT9.1]
MKKHYYYAKVGKMYVKDVYLFTGIIRLSRYMRKELNDEEIEIVKEYLPNAEITKVTVTIEEELVREGE